MPTALLVDDDANLRRSVEASARAASLSVVTAASWKEGLCLFHVLSPDLVIADYNMPGSRYGLTLLAEISRLRPSVNTVLVSGYLDGDDMQQVSELNLVGRTLTKGTAVETAEAILAEVRASAATPTQPTNWVEFAGAYLTASKVSEESVDSLEAILRGKLGGQLASGEPLATGRDAAPAPTLEYLDTSAVMRWVEADIASPEERDNRGRDVVDRVLTGGHAVALSEMTLVEFRAGVARSWRMTDAKNAEHDAEWAARVKLAVMKWVADGLVEVVSTPAHAFEHAMTLADLAARDRGLKLGAWDAVHLITACAWAQAEGARVNLYTSDPDFGRFLDAFPHFSWFCEIVRTDLADET